MPKGLNECSGNDSLSGDLWHWASITETIGKVLAVIIGIVGLFIAYSVAGAGWEFNFFLFLILLIVAGVGAFIQYILFHLIALLIGALAGIYQNTKKAARLKAYELWRDENSGGGAAAVQNSPRRSGEWTCRHCGAVNTNDSRTCKQCGQYR